MGSKTCMTSKQYLKRDWNVPSTHTTCTTAKTPSPSPPYSPFQRQYTILIVNITRKKGDRCCANGVRLGSWTGPHVNILPALHRFTFLEPSQQMNQLMSGASSFLTKRAVGAWYVYAQLQQKYSFCYIRSQHQTKWTEKIYDELRVHVPADGQRAVPQNLNVRLCAWQKIFTLNPDCKPINFQARQTRWKSVPEDWRRAKVSSRAYQLMLQPTWFSSISRMHLSPHPTKRMQICRSLHFLAA